MKYLQLYDHNGNLIREFPVYVDGQDFTWAAPSPTAIWLGTIRLADSQAISPVEPTPELKPETTPLPHVDEVIALPPEPEPEIEAVPESEKESEVKHEFMTEGEKDAYWAKVQESEVEHESEGTVHKRFRGKRTAAPDKTEGAEGLPEEDSRERPDTRD